MNYTYNDGRQSGGRRPRLYLARGGEAVKFEGTNVPGVVAVATTNYVKNGKWSNTTFGLVLAAGVRPIEFLSQLHGSWGDEFGSWGEVCTHLQLPLEEVQRVLREEYSGTAARLDAVEAFAAQAEANSTNLVELVVVCFGSPTNRQQSDGWWGKEKSAKTADGTVTVTVRPGQRDGQPDWDAAELVEPADGKVIGVAHRPGMHGGTFEVKVAVTRGAV